MAYGVLCGSYRRNHQTPHGTAHPARPRRPGTHDRSTMRRDAMPVITLLIEQYVQVRFGFMAALGLALLTVGVKSENATCAGIGGLLLMAPLISSGG